MEKPWQDSGDFWVSPLNLTYKATTGAANNKGTQFEFKVACLLYLRAINMGVSFKLGTNVDIDKKFDDIVLWYGSDNREMLLFMQLKHREKVDKTISRQAFSTQRGDFSMKQYFESYCDTLQRPGIFGHLRETFFIIYTNAAVKLHDPGKPLGIDPELYELLNTCDEADCSLVFNLSDHADICAAFKDHHKTSNFLHQFILFHKQANADEMNELIKQEIILYCKRLVPDLDRICHELICSLETWWEARDSDNTKEWLTPDWPVWNSIKAGIKHQNTLIPHIQFRESEVDTLARQVFDCDCSVLHIVYNDENDSEVRSLKLLQALRSRRDRTFLLMSGVTQIQGLRGDVLALDIDKSSSPEQHQHCDIIIDILKSDRSKKLVITSGSQCDLAEYFKGKLHGAWKEWTESCQFQQLDEESQGRILQLRVLFQGKEVTIQSLGQSHVLGEILNGKVLYYFLSYEGTHVLRLPSACDDDIYIPRALERRVTINKRIFAKVEITDVFFVSGITVEELKKLVSPHEQVQYCHSLGKSRHYVSHLYPATSWPEFHSLCTYFVDKSVHWIHMEEDSFVWKHTNGDTKNVCEHVEASGREAVVARRFITEHKSSSVRAEDLLRGNERSVVVAGEPGMGKSVLLARMACEARVQHPSSWVLNIPLSDFTGELRDMDPDSDSPGLSLLNSAANLTKSTCPELTEALLQDGLRYTGNMIVFLDAFDEVTPDYTERVLSIINFFLKEKVFKIWIASRYIMQVELEKELQSSSFHLKPLTDNEQIRFLVSLWNKCTPIPTRSHNAAVILLLQLSSTLSSDENISVCGSPLYLRMLADIYTPDDPTSMHMDLIDMYKNYFEKKFEMYYKEKLKLDMTNPGVNKLIHFHRCSFAERYKICSLFVLDLINDMSMKQEIENIFHQIKKEITNGEEKVGIIDGIVNGMPRFVHRTYAEYFAALWLVEHKDKDPSAVRRIVFDARYQFLKHAFNRILAEGCPLHLAVISSDTMKVQAALSQGVHSVDSVDAAGRTVLHLVDQCSVALVELLLVHGADPEARNPVLDCTPVQQAAWTGNWEVVSLLLRQGARVENSIAELAVAQKALKAAVDKGYITDELYQCISFEIDWPIFDTITGSKGNTILHLATKCGNMRCVQELVRMGAKLDVCNSDQLTPLSLAVTEQHTDIARFFLDLGPSLKLSRCYASSLLLLALSPSHLFRKSPSSLRHNDPFDLEIIRLLIERDIDVNAKDSYDKSALIYAAKYGMVEIVGLLLKKGACINLCHSLCFSPLHYAIENGHEEVVNMLIEAGADVNLKVYNDHTVLHTAARSRDTSVARQLLDLAHGADLSAEDSEGNTPLHLASVWGNAGTVKLFLEFGASVVAVNAKGDTALHYAVTSNSVEKMNILLESGADIDTPNLEGMTPLLSAIHCGSEQMIRCLLAEGADPAARNNRGETALHIAAKWRKSSYVKLFLELGAQFGMKDVCGDTPLHVASRVGQVDVIKSLLDHGADIRAINTIGDTALHSVLLPYHVAVLNSLLDDSNMSSGLAVLLLRRAGIHNSHEEIIKLLHLGANTEVKCDLDRSCSFITVTCSNETSLDRYSFELNYASFKRNFGALKLLLDYKADVLAKNAEGETPLHYAALFGNVDIINLLLEKGADINMNDRLNRSPLHYAGLSEDLVLLIKQVVYVEPVNASTTRLLQNKGASVAAQDSEGNTS